jgi:cell wall-associated NlpC family hydrolase
MFHAQVTADAKAHALREFPCESVGAVFDGEYIPLENTAPDPESSFRLASYPAAAEAIIHSHTKTPSLAPSEDDMRSQQQDDPKRLWGILSCNSRSCKGIEWFGDAAPIAPYVGRTFLSGQRDCWCLLRDIYRAELGITTLPNLPRDDNWFRGKNPPDLLSRQHIEDAGFERVDQKELRPWDIVLGTIGSKVTNHCGIYLGGDIILHHTEDCLSTRVILNPWLKRIRYFLRHVELKHKTLEEMPDPKEVLR